MNIVFFVPWITKGRGGTENVGQMMANAMVNKGHKVTIFTFDDNKDQSKWPLADRIELRHVPEKIDSKNEMQVLMELKLLSPDLIVGLHMNRDFYFYVYFAKKLGVPVVLSEHIDPIMPQRVGTFTQEERVVIFTGATKIHLLVDEFKNTLPPFLQDRIEVIPNTVPSAKNLANPKGEANNKKSVLVVARLVERKNITLLLNAFNSIHTNNPDWILEIVGDGNNLNTYKKYVKEKNMQDKVIFHGHSEAPYPYYEKAQLFVIPSIYEGFPMVTLEAMAHGLPLVGFKICNGVNVQIEDGVNGFLSEGGKRIGSLAKDMERLMQDDELRASFGKKSLEFFNSRYSNEIVFNKWEKMFQTAIEQDENVQDISYKHLCQFKLYELMHLGCDNRTTVDMKVIKDKNEQ